MNHSEREQFWQTLCSLPGNDIVTEREQLFKSIKYSISVIIEASFFLHLLDGHSITQNGRWIPVKVDYREIYQKMPKRIDRWKLVRLLKKRTRYLAKKN